MAWIVDGTDDEVIVKEIAFYAQDNTGNVRYLGEHPGEDETQEELEWSTLYSSATLAGLRTCALELEKHTYEASAYVYGTRLHAQFS